MPPMRSLGTVGLDEMRAAFDGNVPGRSTTRWIGADFRPAAFRPSAPRGPAHRYDLADFGLTPGRRARASGE